MERHTATFGLESYRMEFGDLAQAIGEQLALEKVALYFRKPFLENPRISSSRLITSFLEKMGDQAQTLIESTDVSLVKTSPPELTDEEYYDPTDRGVSWIAQERTPKPRIRKRKVWRTLRNG